MAIKKDLKEVRKVALSEVELLRKGRITNQRARETSRLLNVVVSAIRTTTVVKDECNKDR